MDFGANFAILPRPKKLFGAIFADFGAIFKDFRFLTNFLILGLILGERRNCMKISTKAVKICSIVVFAFLCSIFVTHVKAEGARAGGYVGKVYLRKEKSDGKKEYLRAQWIYRTPDDHFVYCVEPWEKLNDGGGYELSDGINYGSLTKEKLDRIKLLAYYGYGYEGHEDEKWYTITQMLIWQTADPDSRFVYTDTLNGNEISMFVDETAELERLVTEHSVLPSFANQTFSTSINKDLILTDENNVLNLFHVENKDNMIKSINGNQIIVNGNSKNDVTFTMTKSTNKYDTYCLLYISYNQDVLATGNFDDLVTSFTVKFKSGKITLTKKAKEVIENKGFTIEGAVYNVYDEENQLVGTITTDASGQGSLDNLPYGTYKIVETKASYGYKVDEEEYYVTINDEAQIGDLTVYEEIDRKELEISKEYLDAVTNKTHPEPDIYYDIYDASNNQLIASIKTNAEGKASIKLIYGTYIIRQRNSRSGYIIGDDFTLTIDADTPEKLEQHIINYPTDEPDEPEEPEEPKEPETKIVEKVVEVPVKEKEVIVKKEIIEVPKVIYLPNTSKDDYPNISILTYLLILIKIILPKKC